MIIPDLLASRAALSVDRVALVDTWTGIRRTYRELDERADRCTTFLRDRWGVHSGDRVAMLAHSTIDLFELLFACYRLGAVLVPLNWRLATGELADIMTDCRPSGLLYGPEFATQASKLAAGLRLGASVALGGDESSYESALAAAGTSEVSRPARPADDPWYLLYTSGTTGRPKGVVYTPGMAVANHVNIGTAIGLTDADTTLNLLPQFHTGGINLYALPTLIAGGTAIVQRAFRADETLRLLTDGATAVFGVPTIFAELAEHPHFAGADLSGVRVWGCGGAPAPPSLLQTYAEHGIALRQGCGMTETGPTVFLMDAERAAEKVGSVGKPQLLAEVRAVDDTGADVRPGEPGELLVRGPGVTPGYWDRPEATASAFTADGWLRTGDVARCDEDGYWYIVDRVKDIYISGGENVYPAEVERVLEAHPAVLEVAVVGVPDDRWGEVGAAAIVTGKPAVRPDELRSWCRERLAGYKVPRHVLTMSDLPRNATGKVVKPELRALVVECLAACPDPDGSGFDQTGSDHTDAGSTT